jgi:hypothetical protein
MLTRLLTRLTGPSPPKDSLETGTLCPHLGIAFRMFTLASDLLIHFPYVYRLGSLDDIGNTACYTDECQNVVYRTSRSRIILRS